MFSFQMKHCSLVSGGIIVELLALVPEECTPLSDLVELIQDYPFSDALEDEPFLDISRSEIQQLLVHFPKLRRALMLFDGATFMFPLSAGEGLTEVTEDQVLSPYEDVIFLAPVSRNAGLLH